MCCAARSIVGSAVLVVALSAVAGCGPVDGLDEGDGEALAARYQGTSLDFAFEGMSKGKLVFRGTSSVALASAMAFVPDDEVGATVLTRTGFRTSFPPRELSSMVEGQPLFLTLGVTAPAAPQRLVANAQLRAALGQRTGSTQLAPRAWFQTFRVAGQSVVRVRGAAPAPVTTVTAVLFSAAGQTSLTGRASGREWLLDVPLQAFLEVAGEARTLSVAVVAGGVTYKALYLPKLAVARLVLTQGDPYALWPMPTCTDALRTCLAAAGPDTSACGDAFTVRTCPQ